MFIEAVNNEADSETSLFRNKSQGSDSQRKYILLKSDESCNTCVKNPGMTALGIEKISLEVYQSAEERFFNLDFKVATEAGRMVCLHVANNLNNGFICLIFKFFRCIFGFSPWQDARLDIAIGSKPQKYTETSLNLRDK